MGKPRKRQPKGITTKPAAKSRKTPAPRSVWQLIKMPIKHLGEHSQKSGTNSDPTGRGIELGDVQAWEDFITVEDVEALWKDTPEIRAIFAKNMKDKDLGRCLWDEPVSTGMYNEMCLERRWAAIHDQLNLAFEICAKAEQKTETPVYIQMGDGQNAEWISPNAETNAYKKKPDYAGYLFSDKSQFEEDGPKTVFNRIPGDAKQFRKARRAMLPPNGSEYDPDKKNVEAQKVLKQIHGYMDRHEARYGYIINNEELVFLRRRDTGWGQLDISEAIRHDVEADAETGVLNSKYVLFYFHWKIARDDSESGWHLGSFAQSPSPTPATSASNQSTEPATKKLNLQRKAKRIGNVKGWCIQSISASWREKASFWVSRFIGGFD